jgi:hypothetical protein
MQADAGVALAPDARGAHVVRVWLHRPPARDLIERPRAPRAVARRGPELLAAVAGRLPEAGVVVRRRHVRPVVRHLDLQALARAVRPEGPHDGVYAEALKGADERISVRADRLAAMLESVPLPAAWLARRPLMALT